MRRGSAWGTGNGCPSTLALDSPAGSAASQVRTSNTDGLDSSGGDTVGRWPMVAGAARKVMGLAMPSSTMAGQAGAWVSTRATAAPSSPSTTKDVNGVPSPDGGTTAQAASSRGTASAARRRGMVNDTATPDR